MDAFFSDKDNTEQLNKDLQAKLGAAHWGLIAF